MNEGNNREYYPLTSRDLIRKLAPKMGAEVEIESEWGVTGRIKWKSGNFSYFKYNAFDLNPLGSSTIAKDKDYASYFIEKLGYPIVPGSKTFFSDEWSETIRVGDRKLDDAFIYAKSLGFPVVVKPNSGSQGKGVSFIHNREEFYEAGKEIFTYDRVMLVQRPVKGKDYRIVVLDNEVISAYQREPLCVVGDGVSSIKALIDIKKEFFKSSGRGNVVDEKDRRIYNKLREIGLEMETVLENGQKVFLLNNANLSTGGDSIDVTDVIHPKFAEIAINLTRDMGLRICGVDLMIEGDISNEPNKYYVLEINSAPGLDHYAKMGESQQKIVEDLYLKVLKKMER